MRDVKHFGWWMFNVSFEDFTAFMAKQGIDYMSSVQSHWDEMRENPMRWWLNLDEDFQQAVLDAAEAKYSK